MRQRATLAEQQGSNDGEVYTFCCFRNPNLIKQTRLEVGSLVIDSKEGKTALSEAKNVKIRALLKVAAPLKLSET